MKRISLALVAFALLLRGAVAFDLDSPPALDADVAVLKTYKAFDNREPQMVISDKVRAAAGDAAARTHLNDQMLALLTAKDSTDDAREFALRQLAQMAQPESAEFIGEYLAQERLAFWARYALENINTPPAVNALVRAGEQLDGTLQIGAINSLGTMRAEKAAKPLGKLTKGSDPKVAEASLNALAKIGTKDAVETLRGLDTVPAAEALLQWAHESLLKGEKKDVAEAMLVLEKKSELPPAVRQAALVQLVKADPEAAMGSIRQLVLKEDERSAAFAMRFVREAGKPEMTPKFVAMLDEATPGVQALLLQALAERGDPAALPAIRARTASGEANVRAASASALGVLGTTEDVPALLKLAADGKSADVQKGARNALASMRGEVDAVLAKETGTPAEQAEAVIALGARQAAGALEAIQKAANSNDATLRAAAIDAYAAMGQPETMPVMAGMLGRSTDAKEREKLEAALIKVGRPIVEEQARIGALLETFKTTTDAANRQSLIKVLGELRGGAAFEALMAETRSTDDAARREALKALGNWDSTGPAERLRELALSADEKPAIRVLAMQGYVRMLGLMSDKPAEERVPLFRAAIEAAARPDEKRSALSWLAGVPSKSALDLARESLSNPELTQEAAAAVEKIAWSIRESEKVAAISGLKEAQAATQDEALKTKIADELKQLGA